ncbi:hypothetical protein [Clostridium tagluense]|uniref:ATP-binding protein n=1 Tax=Clostridium tagluense TaxID=360422 RepID=A0A401UQ84_9CLOT|nr:hypothetical protein [Clostridium tagluense]GCD11680.1 hypothetical protein Ctaglu_33030 [Clostridium tagluense]
MTDKLELKVNVINQLRLLRQSTFKDIFCFLDEDIQNAQRAKASKVMITTDFWDKTITIENNGQILTNPQSLFSIADSGWDEDVKNTENPFGMGFFSNITISNFIEIYSGNLHITFDVNKMINTNNTEILIEEVDNYYDGFKLVLNNIDFNFIYEFKIKERVEMLGKYVQNLDVYYNDELQEKKDLLEGDGSPFQIQIEEDNFKGWLSLGDNYSYGDNINIFYKGRLVCKLEDSNYLKGDIHVNDKTLNLTAPDRKDIIRDIKCKIFKETVREYAKMLCEDSLLNGDENEIRNYSNAISFYIDRTKLKNKLKFITFKGRNEKDIKYLKDIALAKSKNKNISSFKNYQLFLNEENNKQSESQIEEVVIKAEVINEVPQAKGIVEHESSSSYRASHTEIPEIKKEETEEQNGEIIIKGDEPVFWLSFDEISQFEFRLNMVRHYNLKVIVARNKIEVGILQLMKETDNVLHISELTESVSLTGYLNNTEAKGTEQRALMIFELISRIIGFNHNIFVIGDLMVTKIVEVKSLAIKNEIIESGITVLRGHSVEKVYIDRSIIDLGGLEGNNDTKLTLLDYKFILTNIYNIIDQAYLLTKDKKKEELMQEVLITLGQGMI